jgi:ABC-2 type transport system permease protein
MRNIWYIAKRELGSLFVQPIAYVIAAALVGITSSIFSTQIRQSIAFGGVVGVEQALQTYVFLLIFAAPAITMRLLSEEQRSGTMELLMTLPIRDSEVAIGKWLGAFIFYAAMTALTLIYPLILLSFSNPDIGVLWTSYLGTLLIGGALIGVGVLASALSENQIAAFFIGFGACLFLYLAGVVSQALDFNSTLGTILNELSLNSHFNQFYQGLLLATDIIYYVGLTAVCLFAATRVLESRRWR